MYYAYKSIDSVYDLIFNEKDVLYTPIIFDTVSNVGILSTNTIFNNSINQIVINKIGVYRVTAHINFAGVNYFKIVGYLSNSMTNSVYKKSQKINSSCMAMISEPKMKNYLHYSFILDIKDIKSTFVLVAINQLRKSSILTESATQLTIFGRGKTWILIEKC